MLCLLKVAGGMLTRRGIAASHVTASAFPERDLFRPLGQALLACAGRLGRWKVLCGQALEMLTFFLRCHRGPPELRKIPANHKNGPRRLLTDFHSTSRSSPIAGFPALGLGASDDSSPVLRLSISQCRPQTSGITPVDDGRTRARPYFTRTYAPRAFFFTEPASIHRVIAANSSDDRLSLRPRTWRTSDALNSFGNCANTPPQLIRFETPRDTGLRTVPPPARSVASADRLDSSLLRFWS